MIFTSLPTTGTPLSPMKPVPTDGAQSSAAPIDDIAAAPTAEPDAAAAESDATAAVLADAQPAGEAAAYGQQANGVPSGASTPRAQLPGSVTVPSASQHLTLKPVAAGVPGGPPAAETPQSAATAALDAVLQKDAFLVFRALCKLSIKTADAASGTDLTATRGKVLLHCLCCTAVQAS